MRKYLTAMPTAAAAFVVSACRFRYHILNIKIAPNWNAGPIKITEATLTDPPSFLRVSPRHFINIRFPTKADISESLKTPKEGRSLIQFTFFDA